MTGAEVTHGGSCPGCGREIVSYDVVSLPPVAFKQDMYDACFLDTDRLERSYRGQTVAVYHEEVA